MATEKQHSGAQGTGKHPHKSSEDPTPHTREEGTQHGQSGSSHSGSAGASHSGGASGGESTSHGASHGSSHSGKEEAADDLKRREYKDAEGNVHHHTRTSGDMQSDKKQ